MKKVYIKTYGCAFNQLDSQIMAQKLIDSKFSITNDENTADIIIINSCTVKNSAENKLFNDIKKYKEQNKKIIVGGCVPQAETSYLNTKLKDMSIIGNNDLDKISIIANATLNSKTTQILTPICLSKKENEQNRKQKEELRLLSKTYKSNPITQIIPINEGCLNNCTFCKTKQARGHLFSYSIQNIKKCMQNAVNEGAKEIYLTSQDTACYGFDINTNLPNLLKELLAIKGNYKIRIGMGNPNHFKKIIDEVLQIMKNDNRIYKFLHIPIQSGNNRILKEMRRGYTVEDYNKIIQKIKKTDSNITIANDIIVAYPTETQKEFEDTLKSLKQSKTNVLNFSRFWLRPNTLAQKLYKKEEFIDGKISKQRAIKLKEEFEKIALKNNKEWIDWEGQVTITEFGKKGTNTYVCRNNYYKPIIVENTDKQLKIGDKIKIKITKVTWFDFRARIIN